MVIYEFLNYISNRCKNFKGFLIDNKTRGKLYMFKRIICKVALSKNKKNIAKISSGTIAGQVISVVTLPIITRVYGAEIIGMWAFINSIAVFINSISDIGLTNSIMTESDDDVKKNYKVVSTLSIIFSILLSLIITLSYIFFFEHIIMNPSFFFFLLATISLLMLQTQICYTWLNRNGKYNLLMKNPMIHNLVSSILAIIFGLSGFITYGYFFALIIGQVVTLIYMKSGLPKGLFTFKLSDFRYVIKKNKRFVIYQTPTNIISGFQSQLPTILIKVFWGTDILGYYAITVKVLKIPSSLLAKAIGRVFFQVTSKMKIEGKAIGDYVLRNLMNSMKIAILPMVFLMAFGDIIVTFFLGNDWNIAGEFIRILALQYFFTFLMGTVQGLSMTLEKQHYAMITNVLQVIGYTLSAFLGYYIFQDIYTTLILMSIFFIIIQISYFSILFKVMDVSMKKYIVNTSISVGIILILSFLLRELFGLEQSVTF
jgi:O-antigen/teichoic acid export membrane protein